MKCKSKLFRICLNYPGVGRNVSKYKKHELYRKTDNFGSFKINFRSSKNTLIKVERQDLVVEDICNACNE